MSVLRTVRGAVWNADHCRLRAPWRLLLGLAVFALVIGPVTVGVVLLEVIVESTTMGNLSFGAVGWLAVEAVVSLLLVGVVLWVIARTVDRRQLSDYGLRLNRSWLLDCLFGLLLGGVLQTGIVIVGLAAGWYELEQVLRVEHSVLAGLFGLAILFLAVGIYEELVFRGWLLTNLVEGFGFAGQSLAVGLAIVLSSAPFGVLHLMNPGASIRSVVIISFGGVFLAVGYVLTGELGVPIGVHITWNFFQGPVFGLGVSGIPMPVSIVTLESTGPLAATGGEFGPEAGLLGLGALLVGSGAICWWVRRRTGTLSVDSRLTTPMIRD